MKRQFLELVRGAAGFMSIQAGTMVLVFLTQVYLARHIGAADFGIFSYTTGWVGLLAPLASLGLPTSGIRFVANYHESENWGALRGFVDLGTRAALLSGLVLGACMAVFGFVNFGADQSVSREALCVGAVCLPVLAVSSMQSGCLRGLGSVARSQLPTLLQQIVFGFASILAIAVVPRSIDARDAVAAYVVGAVASLVMTHLALSRALSSLPRQAPDRAEVGQWLSVSVPILVFSSLQLFRTRTGVLIVGAMETDAQVAYFAAASRLATLPTLALTAIAAWSSPRMAALYHSQRLDELQVLVRRAALFTTMLTVPPAALFIVAGPAVLGLFGADFVSGSRCLSILMIGQLVSAFVGPVGFLMAMTRFQRHAAWIEGGLALVFVVISVVAIPRFGIEGAAGAAAFVNVARGLVMMGIVWRGLSIRSLFI